MPFGGALIGGIAQLGGALIGASAAKQAAKLQLQGIQEGIEAQKGMFNEGLNFQKGMYETGSNALREYSDIARGDVNRWYQRAEDPLQPYAQSGERSVRTLNDLYGLNGRGAQDTARDNFQFSPDYAFARDEGIKAMDHSASARGQLLTGNQLRDVTAFSSGLASQNYNNYADRLMGMSQQGAAAAGGLSALRSARGNALGDINMSVGNAFMGQGNQLDASIAANSTGVGNALSQLAVAGGTARASGPVGAANSWIGGLNGLSNNIMMMGAMRGDQPGMGGQNPLWGRLFGANNNAGLGSRIGGYSAVA